MNNNYLAFASTTHLQNGGKFYYRENFGFEYADQDDATMYETYDAAEAAVKNQIPENFVGRVFIEDTIDGEQSEIFNNI